MAKVRDLDSVDSNKLILLGHSGAGKTGAVLELAKAGYNLKVADFDDKIADLAVKSGILDREAQDRVDVIPFRDPEEKQHAAWRRFKKALKDWEGTGAITDWDSNTVFVLDSLTFAAQACFDNEERLNPGVKDRRQTYGTAQESLRIMLSQLTSSAVKAHVLVLAHVKYVDVFADQEELPSRTEGYPNAVGKAISPFIATYFNSMIEVDVKPNGKRVIKTQPSAFIKTKVPILESRGLKKEYPVEGGLPEIFKLLAPTDD